MHNWAGKPLRFARTARRHRVGKACALEVIQSSAPQFVAPTDRIDPQVVWIGRDGRGRALEVIAVDLPDEYLVIHVTPVDLRGGANDSPQG